MKSGVRRALGLFVLFQTLSCGGGGGGGSAPALTGLSYSESTGLYRVGEAIEVNAASLAGSGFLVQQFSVSPALPAGLSLNAQTGEISGTPTAETPMANYTVTANTSLGSALFQVSIAIGPELPAAFLSLEPGFAAQPILEGLSIPVRMALASDGRLFFNELSTGNVRVVSSSGTLLPTPFATLPVVTGNHNGLLGLALSPTFSTDGYVYVSAVLPPDGSHPTNHMRVIRYTESNNLGINPVTIVDNLPVSTINNSGNLVFDHMDRLFISVGDVQDPNLAQDDNSPAGKILRYTSTGGIPSDNPTAGSAVWCKGLRNTFATTVQPLTGDLFGGDNGPATDDELNYLQAGKNFGWGSANPNFGFATGFKIRNWIEVIVPTALCFHDGSGGMGEYTNQLFMSTYSDQAIRRFVLSGAAFTDLYEESVFARFRTTGGVNNKPLHLIQGSNGSILVSTFVGIYRIYKF